MPCSCSSSCILFIYFSWLHHLTKIIHIHLFFFLFRTSCKSRFESEFELLSTLAISFFFSALGEMNYVFFFLSGKLWGLSHVDILKFILVFVVVFFFNFPVELQCQYLQIIVTLYCVHGYLQQVITEYKKMFAMLAYLPSTKRLWSRWRGELWWWEIVRGQGYWPTTCLNKV